MKAFGPKPWGRLGALVATPVGASCMLCEETILADDLGVLMPYEHMKDGKPASEERPWHRECLVYSIFMEPKDVRRMIRESAKATVDRIEKETPGKPDEPRLGA